MPDDPAPRYTVRPFIKQDGWTIFSNYTLDVIMPAVPPNAWKVLCFVIRKTVGWHKESDDLAYSQIREGTGISSDSTIQTALEYLVGQGYILTKKGAGTRASSYRLNTDYEVEVERPKTVVQEGSTTEIVVHSTTEIVEPSTTKTVDTKENVKESIKENGGGEPTGVDAINNLHAHLKENDPPAAFTSYQLKAMRQIAQDRGMTYEEVRTLWLSCKPLRKPVGAFIEAMKGDGLPYADHRPTGATVNANGIYHMRGTGVMYDISEIRARRAAALGAA